MSLTKKFLKSKPICKVTFKVKEPEATTTELIGDFNDWKPVSMKKTKTGIFNITVDLETDKEYEFKYLVDGEYRNDEEADAYRVNEFAGAENSVVAL